MELYRDVFPYSEPPRIMFDGEAPGWFEPDRIVVTDTTLRDGQQGWRPITVEEGLRIYELLVELGGRGAIASAELFLYTPRDRELVKRIREYGAEYPKPIGWIRATMNDLKLVLEAGLEETTMLTSISDYHIYYKFGVTRDKAFTKYLTVVEEAMKRGIVVRCTLEDATRASLERNIIPFVEKLIALSERYGVTFRVKVADTLGLGLPFPEIAPPRGIPALVEALREIGLAAEQIEFHGHNDLGLVVANHLAAWLHGAGMSNCTLLGIGERAGNCPLEVMLLHYVGLTGRLDRVNLEALPRVVEVLEEMGYSVPEYQPLVGRNAFRTKAGVHIDGLLKNPEVYLPFDPGIVGRRADIAVTAYGGRAAIVMWLRSRLPEKLAESIDKDDPRVEAIYREVVKLFEESGRHTPLSDEEMTRIVERYFPEIQGKTRS
ncbi:isopropylmalate/homocitrate/citramalate synthase-like protein [Pyrodictium delaneyi]|uniref:Isopropylmalate/homocitrate/citramalate synthase-like protein n=2 Tax=Pyrodictium delaneyi TaxID=1273541 RepID=A0A0P0N4C4_9CREN|nr:2-isopropylmalate synthase [Pyrodictium delaneyi]ALL01582.1 isopropylmalate/homocitrate/citramalate synthase-like protein [Pyrodictium delaneyi]